MNTLYKHLAAFAVVALAPLSAALAQPASASAAGKASLRIVIPLPPGTAQDGIARQLAERLGSTSGQTVIVENKPGASGILATDTVVKSPADGSVLSFTMASTISIAPHTFRKLPYDPLRDLKPVIDELGLPGEVVGQQLDRDRARRGHVVALVHRAHPALTDLAEQAKAGDGLGRAVGRVGTTGIGALALRHRSTSFVSVPNLERP